MAQKVLSISLGSEIVKVCEVALAGKNKVQVYNAIDLIVPEGLCEDGMIIDVDGLASAIKDGLAGEGFSSKKIVFSLNSKRIANKEALIPFCKPNRIKDIVTINATEYFPIANLDNYTINYSILEVVANESVKNYRLSIIATPNEMIEQYYALAKAMGMSVEYLDYSGNSILQLLKLQTAGEGVDAILQFGGENTVVNVMNGATMIMQRSVPYGRASIADAVKIFRNCSDDEADEILATEDIERLANSSDDVADSVRALLSSINRILEFYRNKNPEQPIEHVYMIGDVSSIYGLVELINEEMGGDIEVIEALRGVELKNRSTINEQIASNYLANIGAVLEPMRIQISADGKSGKKAKSDKMPWGILVFAFIVAAAMAGGIYYLYYTAKAENDSLNAQIAALGSIDELQSEYDRYQAELQTMEEWYDTTKNPNETLVKMIADLEKVQPGAVAITHLSCKEDKVTITGESFGKPAVAEFVIQLKHLPYVDDVRTDYITETLEDYSAKDTFVLSFTLKYDDPKEEPKAQPYKSVNPDESQSAGNSNVTYESETGNEAEESNELETIGEEMNDSEPIVVEYAEGDDEPLGSTSTVSEDTQTEGGEQ